MWRYPENATITKHSFPEGGIRKKRWQNKRHELQNRKNRLWTVSTKKLQYNLNGSNMDGSFTVDDFFSPYKIFPIAQENKYLMIFFLFYHEIVWGVYIRIATSRRF